MVNHDPVRPIVLSRGDRIAQLVFQRVEHAAFLEVDELPDSDRGSGGHGSTGGADALNPPPSADVARERIVPTASTTGDL